MKKKAITSSLVIVMIFVLAACSGSGKASLSFKDTTITGQVTEVDGSTISLSMGTTGAGGGSAPPDMPSGGSDGNTSGGGTQPPDMPSGDNSTSGSGMAPPEGSSDDDNGPGGMGQTAVLTISDDSIIKKDGSDEDASISDIKKGSNLEIKFDENGDITSVVIKGDSSSSSDDNGTSSTTFDSDTTEDGKTYTSSKGDDNAVRTQSNAKVTLANSTVNKTGDSTNSDSSAFYGMNAGVLNYDGSKLVFENGNVTTKANGANGIFSYGDGSSATLKKTMINTTKDNSGGIEVAGGGSINATDLTVSTKGKSSASIRSDRGGGTINATGGKYSTSGTGSPSVYSTADINVKNSVLSAANSEAVVVEGKNSVTLTNCDVSGNMKGTYGDDSNENIQNVMIYQSMSGDADQGRGEFTMKEGSLTANNGDMFYITNTKATVKLSNVNMKYANGNLLTVSGNDGSRGWGTKGSNGGQCNFTASNQKLEGKIVVDKTSKLDLKLSSKSSFKGTINSVKQAGNVKITLSDGSKWSLTDDSYITEFSGDTGDIDTNGHHVYVNGKKLV